MYQPVGSAVFVVLPAVLESVSKFSVAAAPSVVSETLPVPVSFGTGTGRVVAPAGGAAVTSFFVTCAAENMKGCIRTKAAVTAASSWRRAEAERRPLRGEVSTWVKSFLDLKTSRPASVAFGETRAERLRRRFFIG